jgi:uncharacterized protein DUF2530
VPAPQPDVSTAPADPPPLKALDPPTVPFAIGGMVLWVIAWLVVLPLRDDHPTWPRICVAGFLAGFPGLAVMLVHDRNRRARRNAARRSDVD